MASNTPGVSPDANMVTDEENNTIVVGGVDSDDESTDLSIIEDGSADEAEADGNAETNSHKSDEGSKSDGHEEALDTAVDDGTEHVSDSQKSSTTTTANPDSSIPLQPLIAEASSIVTHSIPPTIVTKSIHTQLATPDCSGTPAPSASTTALAEVIPTSNEETATLLGPSLTPNSQPTSDEGSETAVTNGASKPTADAGIDIQQLVADITASNMALPPAPGLPTKPSSKPSTPIVETTPTMMLPPKPVLSQDSRSQPRIETFHLQSATPTLNIPSQSKGTIAPSPTTQSRGASYAPGTGPEAAPSFPPRQAFHSLPAPGVSPTTSQFHPNASVQASQGFQPYGNQAAGGQSYGEFLDEERRHTTEARWEKFPEGSRLFVGNLSIEKVSKRDVFDRFRVFGRVAQISMKNAYGFVQYYNPTDAHAALEAMRDAEIHGRRLQIEITKTQRRDGKERQRSPDRARDGRTNDRYDGRDQNRRGGRDDYRPGVRDSPPRRDDRGYQSGHSRRDSRNMDRYNTSRNRSRSPRNHYSNDYRQRSPSPGRYSHNRPSSRNDASFRHENSSDVQFVILEPNLSPDFIQWVLKAFSDRGLSTNIVTLDPHRGETRDSITQRYVKAGAHAIADLDGRAQQLSKIRIQVFDRSRGGSDIGFDRYDDLEPHVAADVVLRAKGTGHQQPAYPVAPQSQYGQPYGGAQQQPQHPPAQYQQGQYQQQPMQYPQQPPVYQGYPQPQAPPSGQAAPAVDLSALIGKIDNATLQQVLASLPGAHANGAAAALASHGAYPQAPQAPPRDQSVDSAAASHFRHLSTASPAPQHGPAPVYGAYPPPAAPNPMAPAAQPGVPPPPGADQNEHVQNIMAQLAKYRK